MFAFKRTVLGLAAAVALTGEVFAQGAPAAKAPDKGIDIVIDDPHWEKLTEAERADLLTKLKAANAIGKDDRIVYRRRVDNRVIEKNTNPLAALPMLGASICRVANLTRRSSCGKIEDAVTRKSCQDEEKARYASSGVRSACGG